MPIPPRSLALVWTLCAVAVLAAPVTAPAPAAAQSQPAARAVGPDTGLPMPRLVSIRVDEVNVRTGPGLRYPVQWVFRRRHMPVEIVAEFDNWRRIRDWEGAEGWVHRSMLAATRALLVTGAVATLRRDPADTAAAAARLAPGMVALIERCEEAWCEVAVAGYGGWLRRDGVWGVYPGERIE